MLDLFGGQPSLPHLSKDTHWEVGKNHQLRAVSDNRSMFSRIGSWLTGASSNPTKVFKEFAAQVSNSSNDIEQVYQYKSDIEKEYSGTRSNNLLGRMADNLWRGGVLGAKEKAIDATYSRLDTLFFGKRAI